MGGRAGFATRPLAGALAQRRRAAQWAGCEVGLMLVRNVHRSTVAVFLGWGGRVRG
jgi:hypothetical protein